MKHRLLYNQRSRPLVVSRENAALTHEAYSSIQPEESPPAGHERECNINTWSIDFYTTTVLNNNNTNVSLSPFILGFPLSLPPVSTGESTAAFPTLPTGLRSRSPPTGISLSDGSQEMKRSSSLLGLRQFNIIAMLAGNVLFKKRRRRNGVGDQSGYHLGS